MRAGLILTTAILIPLLSVAQTRPSLNIYVIDVEGGNAVLFVPPSHESLLIDTGNAGAAAARDAGRIEAASLVSLRSLPGCDSGVGTGTGPRSGGGHDGSHDLGGSAAR